MFKRFITKSNLKGLQNVLYISYFFIRHSDLCTYVNSEFDTCYYSTCLVSSVNGMYTSCIQNQDFKKSSL